jgi:hypothetical protein
MAVPFDVDGFVAVEREQVERHLGVRSPGGGVVDLGWGSRRIREVADVPSLYRCGVDTACSDHRAIRTPPEPAEPPHLLGGDEVGASPRHGLGFVEIAAGEHPPAAVELSDAEQPSAHVRDPLCERVGAGVEHRPGDVERAGST